MSLVLEYVIDHDMKIAYLDDWDSLVSELSKRLGENNLEIAYDYDWDIDSISNRPPSDKWVLELERNHAGNLRSPFGVEMRIYPKAIEIWSFPESLLIGPYSWHRFAESYFENRDSETRKKTHDTLLEIKKLFKVFNPKVFVAQGDNMGFDCLFDCLDQGKTIEEAFEPGGYYENKIINAWDSCPKGFRLLGEKDYLTEDDNGRCVIFYQKLDEIG